jgi:photosynthetic reaction center cytochrome c subunit
MNVGMFAAAVCVSLSMAVPQAPQSAPQPPRWQPPDPTNLKVLPKTISKADLVNSMKAFTQALGVRCEFCHVGEGNDLSTFDFASDEKRQKTNARVMLKMVSDLNAALADIPEPRPAGAPAVTCYTCHRGEKKPLVAKPPDKQ